MTVKPVELKVRIRFSSERTLIMSKQSVSWAAAAVILVCLFMAFTSGCDKEPEICAKCVGYLDHILELATSHDQLFQEKKTLMGELLKANAEIVACWEIIEAAKPDPNIPPVWGQGELPAEYIRFFGTGNGARLDFMQNRVIDKNVVIIKEMARRIIALEYVDPNAMPVEARLDILECTVAALMLVEGTE